MEWVINSSILISPSRYVRQSFAHCHRQALFALKYMKTTHTSLSNVMWNAGKTIHAMPAINRQ